MFDVGHDGRIHPGQSVGAVDADDVLGALALGGDAVGEEEVAGKERSMVFCTA